MTQNQQAPEKIPTISHEEFFETVRPGTSARVKISSSYEGRNIQGDYYQVNIPEIRLYCDGPNCNRELFFRTNDKPVLTVNIPSQKFVNFCCRNCGAIWKTFAYEMTLEGDGKFALMHKYGEKPGFGPPTPARVITLIGSERDYYLKGRRAENQGLGIAAFAYYRRVIENQKNKIFDEIIRVSQKVGAAKEIIDDLEKGKAETQFSRAVETVKHGIPQALLIDGHNPLTLLHSALSEGLHAQTDEQCLELATSIRVVLTDFVERVQNVLRADEELKSAVGRLIRAKEKPAGIAAAAPSIQQPPQ